MVEHRKRARSLQPLTRMIAIALGLATCGVGGVSPLGSAPAWAASVAAPASEGAAAGRTKGRWPFTRGTDEDASGEGGVGMVLDGTGGVIMVAKVVPCGPAAKAGVRAGDRILAIAGEDVATGTAVAKVVIKIRGKVGERLRMQVQAAGAAPREVEITRASMKALFPSRAAAPLIAQQDVALLAVGEGRHYGVLFHGQPKPDQDVTYSWVSAPSKGSLADGEGVSTGTGLVRASAAGTTIQIGEWQMDLEPWPSKGAWIVAKSTLPVAQADASTWRSVDLAIATFVLPRPAPAQTNRYWPEGPCTLTVIATLNAKPLANHRLTLELRDAGGATMPTPLATTNAKGEATFALPAASWTATRVLENAVGPGRDAAFAGQLRGPATSAQCDAATPARMELELAALANEAKASLPPAAFDNPLVGKPLPDIAVRRWLGDAAGEPGDGQALLLFAWATWCGPCKRVLPTMSELAARHGQHGLRVVLASVDRDEGALIDAWDAMPRGGAPVAWAGTDLLDSLDARGIPTAVLVDGQGIVRAVHTGTGASLAAWEAAVMPLLAERSGAGHGAGHKAGGTGKAGKSSKR